MKVYKLTVMIIDHDGIEDDVVTELENGRFANRCISPRVLKMESREIGEWEDENPLNYKDQQAEEFDRLFREVPK